MSVDTLTSRQRETNSISVCLYLLYRNRWLIGKPVKRRVSHTPFGNRVPASISDAAIAVVPPCHVPVVDRYSAVLIVNRSRCCGRGCINMHILLYTPTAFGLPHGALNCYVSSVRKALGESSQENVGWILGEMLRWFKIKLTILVIR